jgi:hypothetical protein
MIGLYSLVFPLDGVVELLLLAHFARVRLEAVAEHALGRRVVQRAGGAGLARLDLLQAVQVVVPLARELVGASK